MARIIVLFLLPVMKLHYLLALLLLVNLPQLASAGTLLIVGDSLSAAYGLPVEQGWVSLLEKQLTAEAIPCKVINASISGDTTANARARLAPAIATHHPAVVILEVGGNDGLRGLSLQQMKNNLAGMIETAQKNNARVLLIGVQLPPNYGVRYTRQFETIYRELAEEYAIALLPSIVDNVGTQSELMQTDGIHPNSKAQPMILARVWEQLRPLLNSKQCKPGVPADA